MYVPVNVLLRTDSLSHGALALRTHMGSQGKLHKDTADRVILVQGFNNIDDLPDLSALGNLDVLELNADFLRCLRLHAHVYRRVRAGASLDDSKLRLEAGKLGL